MTIGPDERAVIVGRTGSGKTTLAKALVANLSALVVIDPKWRFTLPPDPRRAPPTVVTGARAFAQVYPQRALRVIYRPEIGAKGDDVNEVIYRVFTVGRSTLLVDEAMWYADSNVILPAYQAALISGRESPLRVISCTQRPNTIHNTVLSESEHVFVFDLHLANDRKKVAGFVGDGGLERFTDYGFGYFGPTTGGALIRCPPLTIVAEPRPAAVAPAAGGSLP